MKNRSRSSKGWTNPIELSAGTPGNEDTDPPRRRSQSTPGERWLQQLSHSKSSKSTTSLTNLPEKKSVVSPTRDSSKNDSVSADLYAKKLEQLRIEKVKVKDLELKVTELKRELVGSNNKVLSGENRIKGLESSLKQNERDLKGARAFYSQLERKIDGKNAEIEELRSDIEQLKANHERALQEQRATLLRQADDWRASTADVRPLKR